MRLCTLQALTLSLLSVLAASHSSQPSLPCSLQEGLERAGCHEFRKWLDAEENADLLAELNSRNDGTVYCPPDHEVLIERGLSGGGTEPPPPVSVSAPASASATDSPEPTGTDAPHRLRKRSGNSQASRQAAHNAPGPGRPRRRRRVKRHAIQPSNYETVILYLDDPKYVNLGPGQPGRMVKSMGADGNYRLSGGTGSVVNQTSGPVRYDKGVIYAVDGFVSLPSPISDSIADLGVGTDFWNAVKRAGLTSLFDDTPACTLFLPLEWPKHKKIDVRSQLVCPLLGYSPELYQGDVYTSQAGTRIIVSLDSDGNKLVNGQTIVQPDITVKNGVIHVVSKPFVKTGSGSCRYECCAAYHSKIKRTGNHSPNCRGYESGGHYSSCCDGYAGDD